MTETPRITLPISAIVIGERIRQDFGDLDELINSFKDNEAIGKPRLLHPIVLDADNVLIDGGRRLAAHEKAGYTEIDVAYYGALEEGERLRLEVDGNKHKRFNWKENCLAIERYHEHYRLKNALASKTWGVRETSALLGTAKSAVNYAIIIAGYLRKGDKQISEAENLTAAIAILANRREEELNRELVKKTMPKGGVVKVPTVPTDDDDLFSDILDGTTPSAAAASIGFTPGIGMVEVSDEMPGSVPQSSGPLTVPLSSMLHKGDCIELLKSLRPDHIITDIPYGIDMTMLADAGSDVAMKNIDSVRAEHDVEDNLELFKRFFPAAYNALPETGFLVTWMDVMHWEKMYNLALSAGFRVQRWPLMWHKTSPCMNQAPDYNFTKNIEFALVCRKGPAKLLKPQTSCVWQGSNDIEAKLLGHPFAKPAGLWSWIYEAIVLKGQTVLDPFAGVGSATLAAIRYGATPLSCEINEEHYNRQVINVQNFYRSLDKNVSFT